MTEYDYDLFTIGAGSGGVRASRVAAQLGARVGVAEDKDLGGTCVNLGCVPKKLFSMAADVHDAVEDAPGYGWNIEKPTFDWARLVANKNTEIARLNGIYARLLDNAGVTLHRGRAKLIGPHEIEVDGKVVTAKNILVAVGGRPRPLPGAGAEHAVFSDQLFHLPELPQRVLLVGGGYISVEFAGIFKALGVETHIVHRREVLLNHFDGDVASLVTGAYMDRGVHVHTHCTTKSIEKTDNGYAVTLSNDETVEVDLVVAAIGRIPNTESLGLDTVGVKTDDAGAIVVGDDFASSVPHIYALGDVINRVQLTPVAIHEAMKLVHNLFDGKSDTMDYDSIPSAVFSHPPVGTVGLSEAEARKRHGKVRVYVSTFRPMKYTLSGRQEKSLMKLIVDDKSDRVVGCHVVDPAGPEMIQGFGVAIKAGATKAQFDATVGVHPTSAEELVTMRTPKPEDL